MSEYQKSLKNWVIGLSDDQLGKMIENLERLTDEEADAVIQEDMRRMSIRAAVMR